MYTKQLPNMKTIQQVAKLAGPFPTSARMIVFYAKHFGLDHDVTDFLHQFHPDEMFQSRADFITRCDELELMIQEEREMPKEVLRSPQD